MKLSRYSSLKRAPVFLVIFSLSSFLSAAQTAEDHSHHHHMMAMKDTGSIKTTTESYQLPDIQLTKMDGTSKSFKSLLSGNKPVVMNFIFTTCTAICPILSGTFSAINKKSSESDSNVELISITIDPEHDTPSILTKYSKKFNANNHWNFYTGVLEDIVKLQKAMNVYRGSKMNHIPVTFIFNNKQKDWIRVDGFASARDILEKYNNIN